MKILTKQEVDQPGRMIMLYGATGVGKTVSVLQSSPEPIMYLAAEPRSLRPSLEAIGREVNLTVASYQNFPALMEFVTDAKNFDGYESVIFDSYTAQMAINLSSEITDEQFEARPEKERMMKTLAAQVKMSQEGFGTLSSHMFRLTAALGRLSRMGKIVVVICLLQENPKWDRDLSAAPALTGKQFPTSCPAYFDLIGLVEPHQDAEGNVAYPPRVRFQSPDGSFTAKWTGAGSKTQGPLDITKILNLGGNKS
jgi:hypothetical protein